MPAVEGATGGGRVAGCRDDGTHAMGPIASPSILASRDSEGFQRGRSRVRTAAAMDVIRFGLHLASVPYPWDRRSQQGFGRLCTRCRWPLPTDSPVFPLGAAVISVDSLKIRIDREPDPNEDVHAELDAGLALATGEYPPSATNQRSEDDGEDEEFDDEWNRYARARDIRQNHLTRWRRLHSYLVRSVEAVTEFPFLRPWAEPIQVQLVAVLDEERRAFASLLQPDSLREAAAVRIIRAPEFTPGAEFAGLGDEAARTFRRAWHEWSLRAAWSWSSSRKTTSLSTPSFATPLGDDARDAPRR